MRKIILSVIFSILFLQLVCAQESKIKIAIASIKSEKSELSSKIIDYLKISLLQYERFDIVSPDVVDKCDIVLVGDVVKIVSKKRQAEIKLKLKATSPNGELISRMEITGFSGIRLDYKGSEEKLVDDAILDAVHLVRENLIMSLTKIGIVKYVRPDKNVAITLGKIDKIRPGAEVEIFRENIKIGVYEIFDVDKTGSFGKLLEKFSNTEPAPQDKVKVIFNPQETKEEKKYKKTKLKKKSWQALVGGLTLAYLLTREDKEEKSKEPSPSLSTTKKLVITLSVSPAIIPADNITTATITATVKDADTNIAVPNGTIVNFKTDLGMITDTTTTVGGKATAKLQSDKSGNANVTATCENVSSQPIVVTFSPYKFGISANPENIFADGISTSIITVSVREASTGKASVGIKVDFSTSLGNITPSSTTTDSMGIATTTLTSSNTPGIAKVNVKVGDITSSVDVNFDTISTTSITLFASPASIPADGITTSLITATVKDPQTNKLFPDGTVVEFTTSRGILLGDTAITSNGRASIRIISDTMPGVAIITAKVDNFSASTQVNFTPLNITISADPPMLIATGKNTSKITANVSDVNNKPSQNGTVVHFTTDAGSIISPVTTFDGVATTTLTSSVVSSLTTVTVTASTGGTSASTSVMFIPSDPSIMVIVPDRDIVPADGTSYSNITVTVKDKENNLVTGVNVKLTTSLGTFSNGKNTITIKTVDGMVSDRIKSSDFGIANVQAECKDISTATTIEFTQLKITLSAFPTSILADGISTTTITVDVVDAKTNIPQNNIPLILTTSDGILKNTNGITDAQGKFQTTLTSSQTAGFVNVSAKSGSAIGIINVVFAPLGVSSITLSASPSTIPADGISTSIITATLRDNYGNFVKDGTRVDFTSSDPGSKITPTSWTKDGVAIATLTASTYANKVLITATSGNIYAGVQVTFSAGVPAFVRIGPPDFNIQGWDVLGNTTTITAYVYDSNHNPVSDGTPVNFTTEGGMITASSGTRGGIASATLTSTGPFPIGNYGKIGYSTITATSGSSFDTTVVLFSGKPFSITLTATPTTIPGKGGKSTIVAKVYDVNGNPVDSGFPVKFMTTLGGFNPEPEVKDADDAPVAEIVSPTSGPIHSFYQNSSEVTLYGWEAVGTAVITAICGNASATVKITLTQ